MYRAAGALIFAQGDGIIKRQGVQISGKPISGSGKEPAPLLSDPALIAACLEGDYPSWDALIERYQGFVYTLTLRMGVSGPDADDVFQNVCISLFQNLRELRDADRLSSWLAAVTRQEVWRLARRAAASGQPEYVLYDTRTSNGDVLAELGCKGAVGVLIEPADSPHVLGSLRFLAGFASERGQGAQVTIFRAEGDCPVRVGDRLMQRAQGPLQGTREAPGQAGVALEAGPAGESLQARLESSGLIPLLVPSLAQAMREGRAQTRTLSFPAGSAEALIEPIQSPLSLLLFGAGQDAVPLAQMASLLGWQVTVVDPRPSALLAERFPGAETVLLSHPDQWKELPALDARTAAVIMSHNYIRDLTCLQHLLKSPLRYIGLLGPRKRAEQMRADLSQGGTVPDLEAWSSLYSPAGLDIGSETAEEIALAIVAEIQAALHDRSGGFLRERRGPIHI